MKILLINGGKPFAHSGGELNNTLHDVAWRTLAEQGHEVRETVIEQGYEVEAEVEKFLWADTIVYQMPGWWMGAPWSVKRYIDEVFTAGHGSLYASDGQLTPGPYQAVRQRRLITRAALYAFAHLERAAGRL